MNPKKEAARAYADYLRALTELKVCKDALNEAQQKETAALNRVADARKEFLDMIAKAVKSDPNFSLLNRE